MKIFALITLLHHLLGILLMLISFKYCKNVLFDKKLFIKSWKFSPVLNFYFMFLFVYIITSVLYFLYLIIFWRPDENIYDARIMWWLGMPPFLLGYLATVIEICLCFDRCLSIVFPLKYTSQHRLYCSYVTVCSVFLGCGVICWTTWILSIIPQTPGTPCMVYGCLLVALPPGSYLTSTKFSLVFTNFVGGVVLYVIKKCFLKGNSILNRSITITVVIIVASTTFFEVAPTLVSILIAKVSFLVIIVVSGFVVIRDT